MFHGMNSYLVISRRETPITPIFNVCGERVTAGRKEMLTNIARAVGKELPGWTESCLVYVNFKYEVALFRYGHAT